MTRSSSRPTRAQLLEENAALRAQIAHLENAAQAFREAADRVLYFDKETHWLTTRFREGCYQDVPGLCKVVTQAEIAANDYSCTAGRYVGVAAQADDVFNFEERLKEIKSELSILDEEAFKLAKIIQLKFEEIGI